MALDVGSGSAFESDGVAGFRAEGPYVISPPSLQAGEHIGAALKAIREFKGHSVDFISGATRVRPNHLVAIEAFDLERLPSRPFAIGYIRAYAEALGQDPEAAVERFKRETPPPELQLRAPIGDDVRAVRRNTGFVVIAAVMAIAAVVAWNVTRHMSFGRPEAPSANVADAALNEATAAAANGPIAIGGPLPAPPEASTPAPYETPGLAAATAAGGSADAALAARAARAATPVVIQPVGDQPPVGSAFATTGQVYGVGPQDGSIVIMAGQPSTLIVRGGTAVYFSRVLAAGEAYRVPNVRGLTVEASRPGAMRVYTAAGYHGILTAQLTPLTQFGQ